MGISGLSIDSGSDFLRYLCFDTAVVFFMKFYTLFRLAVAIL